MFGMALAAPGRHCEEPQGVREDARLSTGYGDEAIQGS
jgi:hypothetical protein